MDESPLILGRYRPLEALGSGGFGEVELAYDTRMQRRVAIKRMPLPTPGLRAEAPGLSEARTAAMLNHPAIVTVYDFDTDADEAFLIMEYVDGASLADVLSELGGALDLDEAAAIFGPVFEAIEFAHDNGVLHLDLKPENILIGHDGRPKVADFGVAALSSAAGHEAADGGTLGFMPIEQLEGGRVTSRTDVWALGALAYESLADANPWLADDVDTGIALLEQEQPLPSHYVRLAEGIDDAIATATETDAGNRFASVREFAEALLPELGDASEGRASIGDVARALSVDDDAEIDRAEERLGLWDRFGGVAYWLARVLAGAGAGVLAAWALDPLGLSDLVHALASLLVAAATIFAPGIGLAFGMIALAMGTGFAGRWPDTALTIVIGAAVWWFARREESAAFLVLVAGGLAAVSIIAGPVGALVLSALLFVVPLAAGFTLEVVPATLTAVAALWVTSAVATSVTPDARYAVLSPTVWLYMLVFAGAAAATSWPASRATKAGGLLGVTFGSAVLALGMVAQTLVMRWWSGDSAALGSATDWIAPLAPVLASFILMLVVAALGAPLRSEPDDPPLAQTEGSM